MNSRFRLIRQHRQDEFDYKKNFFERKKKTRTEKKLMKASIYFV